MLRDVTRSWIDKLWAPVLERLLELPEPVTTEVQIRRDIQVPMPDGVHLATDHVRPPGHEPLPTVVFRTPYNKKAFTDRLWATLLVRQGFQVITQDTRGRFGSQGRFDAFRQERADGLATAAWIRAQPWSDGTLATAGASYLGHTQWAVAPYIDPPLAAMCPSVTTTNFAELFYPGGCLGLRNLLTWSAAIAAKDNSPFVGLLRQGLNYRRVQQAMAHLPLGEADNAATGKPEPFWRNVTNHVDDDYWDEINHTPGLSNLATPVSMVTGWWDLILPGQIRDFEHLQQAGCPCRITIGPWNHGTALKTAVKDSFSWLAAHLQAESSATSRAPVRAYLQKADQWFDFDQWPPAQSAPTPIYLQPDGVLDWQAPQHNSVSFSYNPADPTPTVGGSLLDPHISGQRDNGKIEARPDVLVFTSSPLVRDLDVVGNVSVTMDVTTDNGRGDIFVRLCDVDRKGISRNVIDGIQRLDGQQGPTVDIALNPTAYRFARGHRLRIQVSGGDFPTHARNLGTGDPPATARKITPLRYQVGLGPSALTLPVMSGL